MIQYEVYNDSQTHTYLMPSTDVESNSLSNSQLLELSA